MAEDGPGGAGGYRLFVLDDNGRVKSVPVVITAQDDKAATLEAEASISGKAAELWQGARLVSRFACEITGQFASRT